MPLKLCISEIYFKIKIVNIANFDVNINNSLTKIDVITKLHIH